MILSSAGTLLGVVIFVVLALAFWQLDSLAPTRASRIGLISSLVHLGVWLVYGMLWVVTMLPIDIPLHRIYEVPMLFESLWILGTVVFATSLLCLAWTLHRGIHPKEPGS
jgi:hypothetical protein